MKGFPRRFGPYVLAKPLARGGMGALYLAVRGDETESWVCVIKTVLPHLADKEYLQRFRDEAKVVVQLSHDNLVPVFDTGQVGGEIYLGMNFVDGKDLRAVWNRCAKKGVAFPMDVAVFIVRELARGLTYAHGFGNIKLVHRDISPPNILVSFDGSVKLTDFGLASSTLKMEKTAPGIIYGKVSYMSPEQARGESLDGRTDQFAAGIILWELLTGRQLYPAKAPPSPPVGEVSKEKLADAAQAGAEELLRTVRNPVIVAPSKRASRVPPELDRIALRALAPKLADRYPDCAALADDLSEYLAKTAPATDSARVAKFLGGLYSEDRESDRALHQTALAAARLQLGTSRAPVHETGISSLTMPIVPTKISRSLTSRHASRGNAAGGAAGKALDRPRDEVSAAFAQTVASSSNPTSSVVGSLIGGRYRVRRLCGEGGMGRVYEAEHIEIGKRVALKILHPGYSQTPDLVERLKREARAASRILHPNVVDVTDSGTTPDGSFFFVMEYLEGRELGEIVFEEKGLELRRAIAITVQICRALQAAHKAGVIHRDLKPENVLMVTRDGQKDFVKVLDFGIAKNITDQDDEHKGTPHRKLTNPGVAMGTPEYMAPEQAAGRVADARSDVYAVGGILYEMLCGKAAYEGSNFMEILHKKANELPAPISSFRNDIPAEMEDLVRRTMAKNPANRPQTMEELERELNEIAWHCLPTPQSDRSPLTSDTPRPVVLHGARNAGAAVLDRLFSDRRRLAALGTAAFVVVSLTVFGISRSRARPEHAMTGIASSRETAAAVSEPQKAAIAVASPSADGVLAVTSILKQSLESPESAASRRAAAEPSPGDAAGPPGDGADDKPRAVPGSAKVHPGATRVSSVEAKKMLVEGEELLRAQRFAEARAIFTPLTGSKGTRGRALLALAEIAFQEKNYQEAIRSAKLAADRGGGARARVLLGDAHFRLNHYQDAVTAYTQALRLEPENPSAKSGLALASKRL